MAVVRATRRELTDDGWDSVSTVVELLDDVPSEALAGLSTFSHVEVVCVADRAGEVPPGPWSRRPRGVSTWPEVGVFAQRNKDRPNRLLVSVAQLLEVGERTISLRGLDAIDGTPVVDIKPVFRWSGPRGEVRAPRWSDQIGEFYY